MIRRTLLAAMAVILVTAAPAHGHAFLEYGLTARTGGVALGPDGNLWVTVSGSTNVVRISPSGQVIGTFAVGGAPNTIAVGPGNRVWVSVPAADKLVWFDATSASPTPHDVSTGSGSNCGAGGIVAGGNGRMYFALPSDGTCSGGVHQVGYVADDGTGIVTKVGGLGRVNFLAVSGGKLFAPDFDGGVVRRLALNDTLTVETTITATGSPDGIASDGDGNLWVTLFTAGAVARFPATQNGGAVQTFTPPAGTFGFPVGIALGPDGAMYSPSQSKATLARIDAAGTYTFFPTPGGKPLAVAAGPDQDLWVTDLEQSRVLRFVNNAPRVTTGDASALTDTGATLAASADPRGNDTQVVFDYGTTAAYGQTSAPAGAGAGVGSTQVQAGLTGLAPNTTYHYRARATNGLGEATGDDRTFTTLPPPPPPDTTIPVFLSAKLTYSTFAVDPKGAVETIVKSAKPKKGTTFVYTLSEAARVLFKIEQKLPGRKVSGKCKRPSRGNRKKPKCTRLVKIGTFAQDSPAGETRRKFSGRIGKRSLKPGSYRATLTATDAAGNKSKAKVLSFKVVPAG